MSEKMCGCGRQPLQGDETCCPVCTVEWQQGWMQPIKTAGKIVGLALVGAASIAGTAAAAAAVRIRFK